MCSAWAHPCLYARLRMWRADVHASAAACVYAGMQVHTHSWQCVRARRGATQCTNEPARLLCDRISKCTATRTAACICRFARARRFTSTFAFALGMRHRILVPCVFVCMRSSRGLVLGRMNARSCYSLVFVSLRNSKHVCVGSRMLERLWKRVLFVLWNSSVHAIY